MVPSRYESRGVSSDKLDVQRAIRHLDKGLFKNTFCKVLQDPFSLNPEDAIILHADTAGTKTVLAYLYWRETGDTSIWKGIAQDALVMNTDDMACSGATGPYVISNTILRNKMLVPAEVLEAIIEGTVEFIDQMRAQGIILHHAGGETADVGDVMRTIDVGFTAYTQINTSRVFENNIQPGDLILGFGSFGQTIYETTYNSGIGCNGLTSARHDVLSAHYSETYPESFDPSIEPSLVYSGKYRLNEWFESSGQSYEIGQLLLSPTRTFLPLLHEVFSQDTSGVHGIIHNTGGAHSKVLKFTEGVTVVKDNLLPPPPVFKLIQECSGASQEEMFKVFNMGTRLEMYGTRESLLQISEIANRLNIPNQFIGRVESGKDGKATVQITAQNHSWEYHT
ncbi:MAG: AIR synthase related protein [Saprospiraceae bacterium]